MKLWIWIMSLAVFSAALPASTWANGDRATAQEERGYAEREAQSPGLEDFTGGTLAEVILAILLIAAIGVIVYLLFFQPEHTHRGCGHAPVSP